MRVVAAFPHTLPVRPIRGAGEAHFPRARAFNPLPRGG